VGHIPQLEGNKPVGFFYIGPSNSMMGAGFSIMFIEIVRIVPVINATPRIKIVFF
tara:strand:+ start:328 stop:492 length:165 start_codon:yes stop_codon:yes gene_type:complete